MGFFRWAIAAAVLLLGTHNGFSRELLPAFSLSERACSPKESWRFSEVVSESWREFFRKSLSEKDVKAAYFQKLIEFRGSGKDREISAIADYFESRALYQMGFLHLARDRFAEQVRSLEAPKLLSIRLSAMECLNRVGQHFATLIPPRSAVDALTEIETNSVPESRRQILWEAFASSAAYQVSQDKEKPYRRKLEKLLENSGGFEVFLGLIEATAAEEDEKAADFGERFLTLTPSSPWLQARRDLAALLLSQAYYNSGNYKGAIRAARQVRVFSNLFPKALNTIAWAYLQEGDGAHAMGVAQTFLIGSLRKTFAPEANAVAAMALNETCFLKQSYESLQYFQKKYRPIYDWLSRWSVAKKHEAAYDLSVGYLRGKSDAPERVLTEWIGSPVFLSNQAEMNLLIDEKAAFDRRNEDLQASDKKTGTALTRSIANFPRRKMQLREEIEKDLSARADLMRSALEEQNRNLKLVQAEVFNSLSEKMIKDQILAQNREPNEARPQKAAQKDEGLVWDWGGVSPGDSGRDDAEVWEDELGFLRLSGPDQCD